MTKVIFRRWKKGPKSVIALFPEIDAGRGFCQCYEHIGQHGSADYRHVISGTIPADKWEDGCLDLIIELEKLGYDDLYLIKRFVQTRKV